MDVDFVYFVDMYQGRPAESFAVGGQNDCNLLLYYFRWGKIIVI